MSKINSKIIVNKFVKRIESATDYYKGLLKSINPEKHQATLETILAEQFVFNMAVFWEVFLNDIILFYIIKSPKHFLNFNKNRITSSIKDKYGPTACNIIEFKVLNELSLKKVALLIDKKNFNMSFKSVGDLTSCANNYLVPKYAKLFSLNKDDVDFVNFEFAIRNYLAHRSKASFEHLKSIIPVLSEVNINLNNSVSKIGHYLKQNIRGESRSILIGKRIIDIAKKLI